MKNDEFKNIKGLFGLADSIIGTAFSLSGTILMLVFVVGFPLAILAHCGIIPGAAPP